MTSQTSRAKDDLNNQALADNKAGSTGLDGAHIGLLVLVVLAVIASVVMLLMGSAAALKIALLAALWAAVIGFFLVTRYRNQAQARQNELELRERAHQAELEKLNAEHDAAQLRSSTPASALPADADTLTHIKEELAAIRAQLEELSGREFGYEPAALQAEARRIMELEAQSFRAPEPVSEPDVVFTQTSSGAPSASAVAGRVGTDTPNPRHDNPLADLINERAKAESAHAADARPAGDQPAEVETADIEPTDAEARSADARPAGGGRSAFDTGSFQAVSWATGGSADEATKADDFESFAPAEHGKHEKPEDEPARPSKPVEPQPQEPEDNDTVQEASGLLGEASESTAEAAGASAFTPDEPRRGRRRSDGGRDGAVTVAELLAAMKKGK